MASGTGRPAPGRAAGVVTAARRAAAGDLVRVLDGAERSAYLGPRGAQPKEGGTVELWHLPGVWHVWSRGPETGTWWLRALDEDAATLAAQLEARPARGLPVVTKVWRDCIAVRSREIRRGRRP